MRIFNRRNNNGSTTTEPNALIQSGWVAFQPGPNTTGSQSITFSTAYTTVPVVIATFGGDTVGVTSTLGSGGPNVANATAEAYGETTTGFTIRAAVTGGTWSAGNTVYIKWIAIGQ